MIEKKRFIIPVLCLWFFFGYSLACTFMAPKAADDPIIEGPSSEKYIVKNKVVFQSKQEGKWDIYMISLDGSGLVNLTNYPGSDEGFPCFSPTGGRIAYTSNRDGKSDIFIMYADGSGQANLLMRIQ